MEKYQNEHAWETEWDFLPAINSLWIDKQGKSVTMAVNREINNLYLIGMGCVN